MFFSCEGEFEFFCGLLFIFLFWDIKIVNFGVMIDILFAKIYSENKFYSYADDQAYKSSPDLSSDFTTKYS